MNNSLEFREQEIFKTVKELNDLKFVIIGGYAVNAYTLPRFSVDCDLVVKEKEEVRKITKILVKIGYEKEEINKLKTPYHGNFTRYEKDLKNGFRVSVDILIGKVIDRVTGAFTTAEWIFENSTEKILKGKTIFEKVLVRVPKIEALIVLKLMSCRNTDIRDIFMMISQARDFNFIKKAVEEQTDFKKQVDKLKEKVFSKNFKDNLQGVFGFVQEKEFNKNKELILKLANTN